MSDILFVSWWKGKVEAVNSSGKIVSLTVLKKKLTPERKKKRNIAFTNGCFDILHAGHISYLEKAKGENRVLIVGVNSDASVRKIKGSKRPIVDQKNRARLLAALACVDYVVIFNEATPLNLITAVSPDVLIKGADWKDKEVVGSDVVRRSGGKVELIKYIAGLSTTNIIDTIRGTCQS